MIKNKIYGVLLIIGLLISSKVFANNNTNIFANNLELAKIVFGDEIAKEVEERTYYEFIKESIPSKFVNPFYEFTYDNKDLGIELLGTAKHESGWIKFEGSLNNNGSRDYGPLMLNSKNLENEDFMNLFSKNCREYEYDRDIYYMCICINFYTSIRKEYGPWNALQIYNGGLRTVRKTCSSSLKNKVIDYANKVYDYINEYDKSYKFFISSHKEDYTNHIAYTYIDKVKSYIASLMNKNIVKCQYNFNNDNSSISNILINNYYLFDREFYNLYILCSWMPKEIFLTSPEDFYLEYDEEYYMLC